VGIPMPPIGAQETVAMYAGQSGYQDAGNGPYTHYVNRSSGSCSDSGSGTPAQPRCNIPLNLAAGDVVEVHGGPYSVSGRPVYTASGTASRPVFLRGIDDGNGVPIYQNDDRLDFAGSYFIIEGLVIDGTFVRTTAPGGNAGGSFIALRNLEIRNAPSKNGTTLWGNNIVLINSHIHHHQGDDRHGTTVGENSNDIWIVDNYFHHNGGDAIQFCHGCSAAAPRNVYVGRNVMHSDRENGVDLKYTQNVVISENTIYAYRFAPQNTNWCFDDNSKCGVFSSGSDGAAVVIGSDGGPSNVWIILNQIYDANAGIRIEEGYDVWILGNTIHNIIGESARAIGLDKNGQPLYIAHNTISDAGYGIDQNWRENFTLTIDNNIFEDLSFAPIRLESGNVASSAVLRNNIFWNGGGTLPLVWNTAQSASSSAQINSITGGSGNIMADPRFVSKTAANFRLQAGSPGIDAGNNQLAQYDATFKQRFPGGGTLLRDLDGKNRPLGSGPAYDIGAYESGGGIPPAAPTGLSVQ
jgi:hypothetical protein